jgi:hypothetical protein
MGNEENYSDFLQQKSQKFYSELNRLDTTETLKNNNNSLSEKIHLKVFLSNIDNECSYQIRLFNMIGNKKFLLNDTNKCTNQNNMTAVLDHRLIIRYYFEKQQPLFVEIMKNKSGYCNKFDISTSLGRVMGSRKNTLKMNISNSEREILIIEAEKLNQSEDIIIFQFDIRPQNNGVSFLEINNKMYYEIYSDVLLYRSECLSDRGLFNPVKIPLGLFKNNNVNIKFYKNTRKVKGDFNMTVNELINGKIFDIIINGTPFQIISKCKMTKNFTFVDYLKAGIQIGLSVAIDFTNSNGHPKIPTSLHYINGPEPNQYERAIFACGNIVGYYDYDQLFPCFGFGAKINDNPCPLFNLNLHRDPNVKYIQGIIDAYHNAILTMKLWGPTNFSPIIKKVNEIIKKQNNILKYHILMILTDGMIDDLDDTIEQLVESSKLPLSVIIIGVGKGDFTTMVELDADQHPLVNSRGEVAKRDLVQFVPFLKYESNPELLINEVLAEIPRQLIEFYEQNNLDPIKLVT